MGWVPRCAVTVKHTLIGCLLSASLFNDEQCALGLPFFNADRWHNQPSVPTGGATHLPRGGTAFRQFAGVVAGVDPVVVLTRLRTTRGLLGVVLPLSWRLPLQDFVDWQTHASGDRTIGARSHVTHIRRMLAAA